MVLVRASSELMCRFYGLGNLAVVVREPFPRLTRDRP